ncbi:hypothetical protein PSPO01_16451 [Paraphaeosphaeria sporulosa]
MDKVLVSASEASPVDEQKPDQRAAQTTSSTHWVVSTNELEGETDAQEDNTQPISRDAGLGGARFAIDGQIKTNNESTAGYQNDQGNVLVASTTLGECSASTEPTSPISEDAVVLESIIGDTNEGEVIVIDSTDEEMNMNNDKSCETPQRRVQRNRASARSSEMADRTSREHEITRAARRAAAWKMARKPWGDIKIHAESNRQLARILDPFREIMSDIQRYELWNEKYRKHDGRRAYDAWERKLKDSRTGSGWLCRGCNVNDGDSEVCDDMLTSSRRHRKRRPSV